MESPFRDVLQTNIAPSDAECKRIRAFVQGPQQQVAELDSEIARLHSLLDAACRARDELQEFVNAHLALVSPMRRIPMEIIQAIFLATLPTDNNPAISPDESPLLLCRVCRSWRAAAITMPRLWASIHLVVPEASEVEHLVNWLAHIWLPRSGMVALNISVACSRISSPNPNAWPLMTALAALSPRWKNVRLALPTDDILSLASLSAEDVPSLNTLDIAPSTILRTPIDDPPALSFVAATSIRRLTIPASSLFLGFNYAWANITHLKLTSARGNVTYDVLWGILHQSTKLESCEVTCFTPHELPSVITRPQRFSLPLLRNLAVTHRPNHRQIQFPSFFSCIETPNLRSLNCYIHRDVPTDVGLAAYLPPASSLQHLDELTLKARLVKTSDLRATLFAAPLLHELHLSVHPCDDARIVDVQFLANARLDLKAVTDGVIACPELQVFTLNGMSGPSDDQLCDFILERNSSPEVPPLSLVNCSFSRAKQRDIMPDLSDAVAEGLVVALKYQEPRIGPTYSPFEGR